ncbi:MAG: FHA domain-containing protein [Acidobacteria bacterium]|nr:FHA domain-containing protein [Acidobacteriota bacterium]
MIEVVLTFPTPEGTREIAIDADRTTFGRGSDVDHRIDDQGLSRLNSTIYRDGDRVWIIDENSTNGTYINGQLCVSAGTPLRSGDVIKIGNNTSLTVRLGEKQAVATAVAVSHTAPTVTSLPEQKASILPLALIAGAVMVISISAVFIGLTFFGGSTTVTANYEDPGDYFENDNRRVPSGSPTQKPGSSTNISPANDNTSLTDSPSGTNTGTQPTLPNSKKYQEMSDSEKRQYLEVKAMRIAQIIGNNSSEPIPAAAIEKIKGFADGYASRSKVKPLGGCRFGDNLQVTFERASKNAPFVVRAFNERGVDPRIGLYLAMIESEHCVCLQSPTGPLGMFQFTFSTAKLHFVPNDGVIKGSSPSSPDERCKPEPAARAAASYMKALTGRYGTGPASVPLAIGSYNSGEGGLSSNLQKALDSNTGLPRDFWTLIANGDKLSKQFQAENFKYVPKFFAAAIIGENPQDFGLNLQPVSTYSK